MNHSNGPSPRLQELSRRYQQFMSSRHGADGLSRFCVIAGIVVLVLSLLFHDLLRTVLFVLALVFLVFAYARMFSRKSPRLDAQNRAFEAWRSKVFGPLGKRFSGISGKSQQRIQELQAKAARKAHEAKVARERAKDKEHVYFSCPDCGQTVRVPKGAGTVRVTCPKCGNRFEHKA